MARKQSSKEASAPAGAPVLAGVRSMTGYGRATIERNGQRVSAEIRAVNGRFLKLGVKVLGRYAALEDRVKTLLNDLGVKRGSVDVSLFFETATPEEGRHGINAAAVKHYATQARKIAKSLKLKGDVPISALLALPGVVAREESPEDIEDVWAVAREALTEAVQAFNAMRMKEGAAMAADIRVQLAALAAHRTALITLAPDALNATMERFKERINRLLERAKTDAQLNNDILEREIVLASDRMDVSEELARLQSHFEQMEATLQNDSEVGKKLDFLTQELFRETNTVGSKANDERITHRVVDMKSVIERIREQVQNLE